MSMTLAQRRRYGATHLLALAASCNGGETLREIADAGGIDDLRDEVIDLAKRAIAVSVGAGTWREARAEAEAKLRLGWRPK